MNHKKEQIVTEPAILGFLVRIPPAGLLGLALVGVPLGMIAFGLALAGLNATVQLACNALGVQLG